MEAINPDLRELQQQVAKLSEKQSLTDLEIARLKKLEPAYAEIVARLGHNEGKIEQVNRTASDTGRQTIWQFVIFTVTMAGVLVSSSYFQTEALRRESNARFEVMEKRMDQMEKNINARIDDMKLRFEDMKQIVLTERKQSPQQKNQ
jgi:hypothetical protein